MVIDKLFVDPNVITQQEMISGWFMDVSFDDLRKEDLQRFVAWMLFSKNVDEVRFVNSIVDCIPRAHVSLSLSLVYIHA